MNYNIKDISVIIATYNRSDDLRKALNSFRQSISLLGEVIIVDQSTDNLTKKVVKSFKNITYYHSDIPSLTGARNIGISHLSKKSKIAVFIDDDVTLDKGYFNGILDVFNTHPDAKGVGGYFLPNIEINKLDMILRKLFLIEHLWPNIAKVYSVYGASYPSKLTKIIKSEWIPGFNMTYKTEVFGYEKFDSKLVKYALAEDFDFSVRVNKRYPGSLYITPYAKLIHHASTVERTPTTKLAYMNQINHVYIHFKSLSSLFGDIKLFWTLLGILVFRILNIIIKRRKIDLMKLIFYLKSIIYTYNNLSSIKKGNLKQVYKAISL